ncbi:MAG: hypothetical protein MJY61_00835 [Bacteroidales bacterium]|nr:hypothetical protein [Bacteroidales bacterium]
MKGEYGSISEFVEVLGNSCSDFLILRNFENLLSEEMYVGGHADIDILCKDSIKLAKALGARPFSGKPSQVCNDGTHYFILVKGEEVSLDIRQVGDGYYCKKWQNEMLLRKVEHNGYFIMDNKDYFYSLVYHSILQKPRLSQDYRTKLCWLAAALGFEEKLYEERELIRMLETYMETNGYTYTFPKDIFVPLRMKYIDRRLLEKDICLAWKHWKFDARVSVWHFLVCLKHLDFRL